MWIPQNSRKNKATLFNTSQNVQLSEIEKKRNADRADRELTPELTPELTEVSPSFFLSLHKRAKEVDCFFSWLDKVYL